MKKKLSMILTGGIACLLVAGSANAASYTVQPGDSLWKIAVSHETTIEKLVEMNHLTSYMINPNQVLRVPDDEHRYIVQEGDTMWKIAQRFGIDVHHLIRANPQIVNPNILRSGLSLQLPERPDAFLNGTFPLGKGTYQPFTNNYSASRSWSPSGITARTHEGLDIFADKGTPIYSVLEGKIINFGWNQYGGWRITIQVDGETAFYYAHLSKYAKGMSMGAKVEKGQLIGYVGNTGYGPQGTEGMFLAHLHFGIYKTGTWKTVDPYPYLRWWEL